MTQFDRRDLLVATLFAAAASPAAASPEAPRKPMRTVHVKGVEIGAGVPKLIVSITAATPNGAVKDAGALATNAAVDLIEFRIDHLAQAHHPATVAQAVADVAAAARTKPLLVTFRSKREGGQSEIDDRDYAAIYDAVLQQGGADLIDLELARAETSAAVRAALATAQAKRVAVVVSNHDFQATPPVEVMVARLRRMQALGADIPKLAVMPHDAGDVLNLLAATWTMHSRYADRPIITMAMQGLGAVSRIAGQTFGSAATFGRVGPASAPGQISADELKHILGTLSQTGPA
jgi:3-dehydroquinate dehydratase-1